MCALHGPTFISPMQRQRRLDDAEAALGAASVEWRQSPVGVEAAERIYVPRAAAAIARLDWRLAADNLAAARKAGVAIERLSPSAESLRREATRRTRAAVTMTSAAKRFSTRLEAEQSWTQWERATGATSPELIGLRTSMAADLHDAERHPRRTSS